MPKFYVQTFVRVYLGDIEVEASSYHEAAVEAERSVRRATMWTTKVRKDA